MFFNEVPILSFKAWVSSLKRKVYSPSLGKTDGKKSVCYTDTLTWCIDFLLEKSREIWNAERMLEKYIDWKLPLSVFLLRHPLFPLLALLFEKCEQATQGSECITSASFDVDIENFVHQQEREHKPFFSEDPELDNLVSHIKVSQGNLLDLPWKISQAGLGSCCGTVSPVCS